ncbi:efflux RND transporter periplasmic adaptor subunit [Alcaligenaceae bacterium 429]|uniref:efflux RND transporter periplasmic adaptor subunit n=1 Tax=Paenalcaligenes sp. Me52 TaxID=3392038 RepID=UPI0010926A17|nr:efflux RND transporter periplasmic adaptor subunit [Alcaligenaceae bacterium 429]
MLFAAPVLLVAGGGYIGWKSSAAQQVETTVAERADIAITVNAIGTLQPSQYVDVGAQVSGQIMRLPVQPGDKVEQGQLLVEIDPSVQQAVVDAGRAALRGLEAQLQEQQAKNLLARQMLAREQRLHKVGATREESLQQAQAELSVTAAKVEHLRAQIAQSEASQRAEETRLGYTRIYAPMSGTVVSVKAREGQTLNATYQTPDILRIADLSVMTVWTDVSEADVRQVQPGQAVSFTTLGIEEEPRRWHGKVRQVLPAPPQTTTEGAEAKSDTAVTYTVLFDVDNADAALMSQMTAQVTFTVLQADNVLSIPIVALQRDAGQSWVWRIAANDKPVRQDVTVGVRNRHLVEIVDGLSEGTQIVLRENEPEQSWSWLQW